MKTILWSVLVISLCVLCGWIVIGPWVPHNPGAMLAVVILFTLPNIGTLWMMYIAVRYEAHPLPFVALAFIPFSFLWYYFERFRRGKYRLRDSNGSAAW
jgi:hypothetical protein